MNFRHDRRRHAEDDGEVEPKRRRGPETVSELERKVEQLIVQIGDKPGQTSLESNLEKLVSLLEGELEKIGPKIIETVVECAKNLPDKLTIYSTLVGLLNAKKYNFGGEIVEKLIAELQVNLEKEDYGRAVNLVTFICDLGNCRVLSLTSVVEFLEGLVEAAAESDVPQVRSDWFIFAILRSLPWIGVELMEKKVCGGKVTSEELENLLGGIEQYMSQRNRDHASILQVWADSKHVQEEYLDCLHEQIKLLAGSGWKEKHIVRLYVAFDAVLADALQHNLPSLAPPPHKETSTYPMPTVVFRLFDYADCPEDGPVLPGAHSIERYLVEDELGWIIQLNELNRREWYVVLETIFARIFSLPESPQPRLFYGALLIELCRLQPNTFPQVLAQAAELLYERSHKMQPACLDRFVDWFSYHLSNFQYRWSWQDWHDCLESDELDNKFILAREVLQKCMHFSYYERILEILPETHERLRPEKPEPCFPMAEETHPEHQRARHFQGLLQEKKTPEDMIEELKTQVDEMGDGDAAANQPEYDSQSFAIFFAVLLKMASKSFSHNFAALAKYHKTLQVVVSNSEDMQHTLLSTLFGVWRNNQQMLLILMDKLMKMLVLDCAVVVQWIFEDAKDQHNRQWVWELLNSSLEKLGKHVAKCRRDLDVMRRDQKEQKEVDEEMTDDSADVALASKEDEVAALIESQKNVFLDVFLKFAVALSEAVRDQGEKSVDTPWFRWMQGRMRQVFLTHQVALSEFVPALEENIFSNPEVDKRVVQVFKEFCALRK